MKPHLFFFFIALFTSQLLAQKVILNKSFTTEEMQTVKMYDETTLLSINKVHIKLGGYKSDSLEFNIFLKDINNNKKYNDAGIDEIGITGKNTDTITHTFQSGVSTAIVKGKPIIAVDSIYFIITEIDENGDYLVCENVIDSALKPSSSIFTKLPNIQIQTIEESKVNLPDFCHNGKYLYIEFWGLWCNPFVRDLPELIELQESHRYQLDVVTLNYNDSVQDVIDFTIKHELLWTQGIADKNLVKTFNVTSFPCGILFDDNGSLIGYNISPGEVKDVF